MINVKLNNCNNIESANINLRENQLNIRFAMNGTGKSTIASAIELTSKNEDLSSLQEFGSEIIPTCVLSEKYSEVPVFNEDYVGNVVLQESEVIPNSFEVFIKSPQYDAKAASINNQLKNIRLDSTQYKDILINIRTACNSIISKLPLTSTGVLREGGTFKSLTNSLSPFQVPKELAKFSPLMQKDFTVKWVSWKHEGSKYDSNNICPFCSIGLDAEYDVQKKVFTKSYAKADVQNRMELLSLVQPLDDFMEVNAKETLYKCIQGLLDDATTRLWIENFRNELVFLVEVINKLENFDPHHVRIDGIAKLDEQLTALIVDSSGLKIFKNAKLEEVFKSVNGSIKTLQSETELLKREIGDLASLLVGSCKNKKSDINDFLFTAGINYSFDIIPVSDGVSKTMLTYNSKTKAVEVENIKDHLSWGERNAFALVLFMHDALSKNPNLIVLDDPISSFDSNKKYAIMSRLFSQNRESFNGKTVLMLTHDLQPIIDFIKVNKPKGVSVSAHYLQNRSGVISEQEITYEDIKSFPKLLAESSKNKKRNIVHRVASLRKLVEHSPDEDEKLKFAYHILSSLLHGKPQPDHGDGTSSLDAEEVALGTTFIKNYIDDFDYTSYISNMLSKDNLLKYFNDEKNSYVRLQVFRVLVDVTGLRTRIEDDPLVKYIDEQFHVENDYMFSLDLLKFDIVPESFISKCSNFLKQEHLVS